MEADNYLASGYGLRLALESQDRVVSFGLLARVWQPQRLKGIQVGAAYGTPFLAATQVFDLRPVPRKWLSLDRTDKADQRYLESGDIVVTCSGSVGRATLAYDAHENILISHDLLRVVPRRPEMWGWVYAYLRSRQARAMMSAAQYGHVIKHLEVSHLEALPIPVLRDDLLEGFNAKVGRIAALRSEGYNKSKEAEKMFEDAVGGYRHQANQTFFQVSSKSFVGGRRRMESAFYNPSARLVYEHLSKHKVQTLEEMGFEVWLPNRFKRVSAKEGTPFIDSADLFEINPDVTKFIAEGEFGDSYKGRVLSGWILLARSGQVYGLNGQLVLANKFHTNKIVSDHVIRIAHKNLKGVHMGYVYTALSHPSLGQPIVKSLAYGSSIPEIDVVDVRTLKIVRLDEFIELEISNKAVEASQLFAEADALENEIAAEAEALIDRFLAGEQGEFEALRLVAAPTKSLEPDPVTGFPPETDFERQMQEWRDNDLSHLGELPPFEWGEHGEPEVHPLRYVEGEGWVTS